MKISNEIASQYIMNQGIADRLNDPSSQLPVISEQYVNHQKKANRKEDNSSQQNFNQNKQTLAENENFQTSYESDPSIIQRSQSDQLLSQYQNASPLSTNSFISSNSIEASSNSEIIYQGNDKNRNLVQSQKLAEKYAETGKLTAFSYGGNVDIYT
ncbi:MAG: hypothetical protein HQL46_10170 [Gammaproteobacteria bacterium]|nr:hypothetical protein [Gammaproteobacteria bacterium]